MGLEKKERLILLGVIGEQGGGGLTEELKWGLGGEN